MERETVFDPMIHDMKLEYESYRRAGKSRAEAIACLKEDYAAELDDTDDRIGIMLGLTLALCTKKELTRELADETLRVIQMDREMIELDEVSERFLKKTVERLKDESLYGEEAVYRARRRYTPDWEIGDLFAYPLTNPDVIERSGLEGWSILFLKVGDYLDHTQVCHQLVYVSLCPTRKVPSSTAELQALGFIPMRKYDNSWDYVAQIEVKTRKDELFMGVEKVGNFSDLTLPEDRYLPDPRVTMPLWIRLRKTDPYPVFEEEVFHLYRRFGVRFTKT